MVIRSCADWRIQVSVHGPQFDAIDRAARSGQRREDLAEFQEEPCTWITAVIRRSVEIADDPREKEEVLAILARDPSAFIRSIVACNTSTGASERARLAVDQDPDVRAGVAYNTAASEKLRAGLAKDPYAYVRAGVACTTCDSGLLERLSRDSSPDVRAKVACNRFSTGALLARLSRDRDPVVRANVARNANTLWWSFMHLALDDSSCVRAGVAGNEAAPIVAVRQCANDDSRAAAKRELARRAFTFRRESTRDTTSE